MLRHIIFKPQRTKDKGNIFKEARGVWEEEQLSYSSTWERIALEIVQARRKGNEIFFLNTNLNLYFQQNYPFKSEKKIKYILEKQNWR